MAAAQIDVGGFQDAAEIDTGMVKEALILHGDERVHYRRRNFGVADQAAAFAIAGKIGDDFGAQIEFRKLFSGGGDARDFPAGEFNGDDFAPAFDSESGISSTTFFLRMMNQPSGSFSEAL